jgi:hypothetical protein
MFPWRPEMTFVSFFTCSYVNCWNSWYIIGVIVNSAGQHCFIRQVFVGSRKGRSLSYAPRTSSASLLPPVFPKIGSSACTDEKKRLIGSANMMLLSDYFCAIHLLKAYISVKIKNQLNGLCHFLRPPPYPHPVRLPNPFD